MKTCVFCNQEFVNGRFRTWSRDNGEILGWGCEDCTGRTRYPEFTTQSIKEGRKQYAKELLQPFRAGEVSKEYLDAYPDKKRGMIKEGIITKKQAKQAKNVWGKDIY